MLRFLFLVLALALTTSGAGAQTDSGAVPVQGGIHPGFYRLVLDFEDTPNLQAEVEGRHLVLQFNRPVKLDFTPARSSLGPILGAVEIADYGRRILLELSDRRKVRSSFSGSRIVLDLRPAVPPPPPPPDVLVEGEPHEVFDRLRFTWETPVSYRLESGADRSTLHFEGAGSLQFPDDMVSILPRVSQIDSDLADNKLRVTLHHEPGAQLQSRSRENVVEVDVGEPGAGLASDSPFALAAPPQPVLDGPLASDAPSLAEKEEGPDAVSLDITRQPRRQDRFPHTGHTAPWPDEVILELRWPEATGLAALKVEKGLLVVLDRLAPEGFEERLREAAPEFSGVRTRDREDVTVLEVPLSYPLQASVEGEGRKWRIILSPEEPVRPRAPLLERQETAQGQQLSIAASGAREVIEVEDSSRGSLRVVPLTSDGQLFPRPRHFPQFSLMETLQGIVVQPLDERVSVTVGEDEDSVNVVAEDGLYLSAAADTADIENPAAESPEERLFDLETWRFDTGEGYTETRQQLQDNLSGATGHARVLGRLDLARFYFSRGLMAEALGALDRLVEEEPSLVHDPEVRVMRAAANIMTEEYEAAAGRLGGPVLANRPEAGLWQAAYAARARDWPVASRAFAETRELIDDYPANIRLDLRHMAAEAALHQDNFDAAEEYLALAGKDASSSFARARQDYLSGRLAQGRGEMEKAREFWRSAAESSSNAASAKARLALLDDRLESGDVGYEEAIDELQRLRFAWRGDNFEYALLTRLADLQLETGRPAEALRSLRRAVTYFPEAPGADEAARRMRKIFRDTLLDEERLDQLTPMKALALYEEFRELMPAGPEGERLIARLADELVAMDLLERAARLLQYQVEYRLAGTEKSRVGARLASLHLLDDDPEAALDALEETAVSGLEQDLSRQRIYLRAHARSEQGEVEAALELLEGDNSAQARDLQAEILWRNSRWSEAADALSGILPDVSQEGEEFTESDSGRVLNYAVALTLAGRSTELGELASRYDAAMQDSAHAEAYALLVDDFDPHEESSITADLSSVAEARSFMTSYRDKLQEYAESGLR
ncbi:tetratricopeptide repeat protein [Fodinicurvata halophila]|uniref:Tetratricopeptide repeat protein n=1 Tax=Fodinicurvata halophila TaxID=1419723 RepID=A0ABV8UIQ4_9PROT